ncbi:MAG: DoxX family protein [Hyphomicrobiales bacterium]|nr:DoxX family protein [Hyphomicrobiales bacterium]MDE2017731.1 DoxX family protein [Hyphomicrobiales bacterium]
MELIPFWFLALVCRIGLAQVFWSSAQAHLANWDATLTLFAEEYRVPLLPPEFAANLAVLVEQVAPPLLVLGLATRMTATGLLGMTAVIEVFVYPQAWPTHIQWFAMILVLLRGGPGLVSLDAAIRRFFAPRRA